MPVTELDKQSLLSTFGDEQTADGTQVCSCSKVHFAVAALVDVPSIKSVSVRADSRVLAGVLEL